jgi:hypothetical protein
MDRRPKIMLVGKFAGEEQGFGSIPWDKWRQEAYDDG